MEKGITFLQNHRYSIFKRLFRDRIEQAIFFMAFLVPMTFGLYMVYNWGYVYVRVSDCLAHLYIARSVIDNGVNSGLAQLGTVWLPVFHLLLIPFVAIDFLYTTGLAGTIVNSLMTAGISVLMYRLLDGKKLGILASLLFLFNPYTLFRYGASVWMPPVGMFFMLLSIYYFKLYLESDNLTAFMKCSLAILVGTLSRYEVWPIAILMALFFVIREIMKGRRYRCPYAFFLFGGILAWLFYNLAIFRNPLIWMVGPFSGASGYYTGVIERIIHPSITDLVSYGFPSMVMLLGFIWIILPIAILIPLIQKNWNNFSIAILLLVPLILIFEIGYISPISSVGKLYFSLPAIILLSFSTTGFIKSSLRWRQLKVLLIIFLTVIYAVNSPSQYARAFPQQANALNALKGEIASINSAINGGSYILATSGGSRSFGTGFSVIYGVSPSKIIDERDGTLFSTASKSPWLYANHVIINKGSGVGKAQNDYYGNHFLYLYHYDLEWKSEFLTHFTLILETENYLVFEKARDGYVG